MISEVNPSEHVKCSSKNICLVIKFFVKCLAISCVGSVVNVKIDVNLQDVIPKCLGYLLRLQKRLLQITNLMHNSFILQQYVCYTTILNMFRAVPFSSSGGQIVSPQPLVSSPWKPVNNHILIK